jgi:LacI family transcriptional regulator
MAPRDLLIVGFDDNPLNDWIAPWLTSVRVPYERYGSAIVSALQNLWDGAADDATILDHQIVARDVA